MILVVDDSTPIQDWLRDVIQDAGYYFDAALDGPSALYKISRIYYSLCIIDIVLPGPFSGDELARKVKTLPEPFCSTPLIAITGRNVPPDAKSLFVDNLQKPFLPRDLREMIARCAKPPIKDLHLTQADSGTGPLP